ncbi:MAG: hypothetical protein ABIL09_03075 [Gemmatimonadota bacterium]
MEGKPTHQALRAAAMAIDHLARGDGAAAAEAVSRGYQLIAVPVPAGDVLARLRVLVDTVYDADDGEAVYAAEVRARLEEKLG